MTEQITGAQALIRALELENVDTIFGLPGGCILPAYDPLLDSHIRHILVRHEQGAGHMAEGYAHVTGRPGVALVTSGPAATNMVTPLCDAYMDSIPMICITGQVPTSAIGTDAFQECDTVGITRSVTKHNELIMSPKSEISEGQSKELCDLMNSGQPAFVYALALDHVRSSQGKLKSKVSFAKMSNISLDSYTLSYVECQSDSMCMMMSAEIQFDPPLESGEHNITI
jgi:glyoxylate carboligase